MPNDMDPPPAAGPNCRFAYILSKTGRPIVPATSFFKLDARQVLYAIIIAMPRDGAIIFSDLEGKLDVLRVACEKCGRDAAMASPGSSISVAAITSSSIGSMN